MNKADKAISSLMNGIVSYVDTKINSIKKDETLNGVILKKTSDNQYIVKINGKEYNNVRSIGGECNENEIVNVMAKKGDYSHLIILKGGSGSGGGGDLSNYYTKSETDSLLNDEIEPSQIDDWMEEDIPTSSSTEYLAKNIYFDMNTIDNNYESTLTKIE